MDSLTLRQLIDTHNIRTGKDYAMNYIPIYDSIFMEYQTKPVKILEIGIERGNSLVLWNKYFSNAEIIGMDNFHDSKVYKFETLDFNSDNIKIFEGDQGNIDDLKLLIDTYGSNYDIIIDDGSHNLQDHQTSLGFLFQHLNTGGVYIIEDLETQFSKNFNKYNRDKNNKPYEYMYNSIDFLSNLYTSSSMFMKPEELSYLRDHITRNEFLDETLWACYKK